MERRNVKRAIVLNRDDHVVGVISIKDILAADARLPHGDAPDPSAEKRPEGQPH